MAKKHANENDGAEDVQPTDVDADEEPVAAADDTAVALAQGRRETIVRLMEAMKASEQGPVSTQVVNETLLALAISVFVRSIGREAAALLVERLPQKIRDGEFGDAEEPNA